MRMLSLNFFPQPSHQYVDGVTFAQFSIGVELEH